MPATRRMLVRLGGAASFVFCLLLSAPVLGIVWWKSNVAWENAHYAEQVFRGIVRFDDVIASRRWHHDNNWCTYAVVTLADDAAPAPPLANKVARWPFAFGGSDWAPTPGPALAPRGDDLWSMCRDALGKDLFNRLATTMQKTGGFWRMESDTVVIHAPGEKLAVLMRESD